VQITFVSFGPPDVVAQFPDLRIRSLGYVHTDARMALAYAAADLFALPSIEDNLPNTLLEALGCGTPSLAFNIGGVPDAITDGKTGCVVMEIGDPAMLARAILTLTADPRTLAAMRGPCRLEAERRFQLAHQASAYGALYAGPAQGGPDDRTACFITPGASFSPAAGAQPAICAATNRRESAPVRSAAKDNIRDAILTRHQSVRRPRWLGA
jgi:hypothetical protein